MAAPPKPGILQQALDHVLSRNLERILAIPGGKLHRRFVDASRDVRGTQAAVMQEILRYAADTEFGRAHGFSGLADYDSFRSAVPLHDHEALMYNQSSGHTSTTGRSAPTWSRTSARTWHR